MTSRKVGVFAVILFGSGFVLAQQAPLALPKLPGHEEHQNKPGFAPGMPVLQPSSQPAVVTLPNPAPPSLDIPPPPPALQFDIPPKGNRLHVDELIDLVEKLRAHQAELEKFEKDVVAKIRARQANMSKVEEELKELVFAKTAQQRERLKKMGLTEPKPASAMPKAISDGPPVPSLPTK